MTSSRNRSARRNNSDPSELNRTRQSHGSHSYVIQKSGLYGWRRRCLYMLILLIVVITIVNLTLLVWLIRVQDFGMDGMGQLSIRSNGVRMEGTAEFVKALRAKYIISKNGQPISINSRKNISLSVVDSTNRVLSQMTLTGQQIVMKNKQLFIQDNNGRTLLYADDKKLRIDIENMDITVPGGLNFESSIQTPLVSSSENGEDLRVESLTKKLFLNAADGIEMNSFANDISIKSLKDIKLSSKQGKIILDAPNIQFTNVPKSTVPGAPVSDTVEGEVYGGIREVCMCKDGSLFLAPPDSMKPCKLTKGVC